MITLHEQAHSKVEIEHQLRLAKEKWLDQMRYKRVKLQKLIQKEKRISKNRLFENKKGKFDRKMDGNEEHTGHVPSMGKFVEF